jgi:hypothetical protein
MHDRLLIITGILLSPTLVHAQTPAVQPPPTYYAPAAAGNDGTSPQPVEASSDRWYARPIAVEGHMGFGTPLGFAGAAIDLSPSRWFGGGVGIGAGAAGPQAAAMARFRIPLAEGLAFGLGGGLSGGNYEWKEGGVFSVFVDNPSSKTWKPAYWANADLAIEGRLESGFTIRGYLGRAAVINPSDGKCGAASASDLLHCETYHKMDGFALGYVGLAMGYAFAR